MITNPVHQLMFGAINLIGTAAELAAKGYMFEALADDTDFGNPVPIEQKVISWLQDGALLSLQGYDNRDDMLVRICITGTDSNKLALAEQALMLETGKPNTLTWTPPDGVGAPCVFSVVMSYLEHSMDDMAELRLQRIYTLRIKAEPFVRSQTLMTVTKAAPSLTTQTFSLVDACNSVTGWTGAATVTPSGTSTVTTFTASSFVIVRASVTASTAGAVWNLNLTRTGLSASITTNPYVRVELSSVTRGGAVVDSPRFKINGTSVPVAVQEGNIYWIDTTGLGLGATITSLSVDRYFTGVVAGYGQESWVGDISTSNVLGTQSTNRQLSRIVEVAGSARSPAGIAVQDASAALGTTLVFTSPVAPGAVQPNLRTLISSGNSVTVAATTISGFTSSIETLHTFDIPTTGLTPGGYVLLARIKTAATISVPFVWSARSRQGTVNLGDAQTGAVTVSSVIETWAVHHIATMNLPPRQTGEGGKVRIELESNAAATVLLDEAWLFNLDVGELTWVECGSAAPSAGGSANRLWLDAATINSPRPSTFMGFDVDRLDSYHAGSELVSNGAHEFVPPLMNVFTVTSNSQAASVTLSHYPRFHSHVVA